MMLQKFAKRIVIFLLTAEARLVLCKYKPRIVAVTGTVGKTSTKDALYAGLAEFFYVRRSEGSFNSDIGVPLTILGCRNAWRNPFLWFFNLMKGLAVLALPVHYPRWLVIEVGADHPGDVSRIARWLSPHIVVVTRFAEVPVHIEFFPSAAELLKEKGALVSSLRPDGLLVLNGDDGDVLSLREFARASRLVTFGTHPGALLRASFVETMYDAATGFPAGISMKADFAGSSIPIVVRGALGEQLVFVFLAALAVGIGEKLDLSRMALALRGAELPPGRMRLLDGANKTLLIDDTYNSSPVAAAVALAALRELRSPGKKFAVLGDMLELGKYSAQEHKRLGKLAAQSCDILVTVGLRAKDIAETAIRHGLSERSVYRCESVAEAAREVRSIISPGDVILLKGSQQLRMEKIAVALLDEPRRAAALLVRQEREWTRR